MKAVRRFATTPFRTRGFVLAALLLGLAGVARAQTLPEGFARIAEAELPAVVGITTRQTIEVQPRMPPAAQAPGLRGFFEEFFGDQWDETREREVQGLGSGFLVSADGLIVTNYHVVASAEEARVVLHDGRSFRPEIVGHDPATDLALLRIDAGESLPYVTWGDSDAVAVGDWVVAIGSPFGLGGSVTAGVLSGRARDIQLGPYDDFLQTDASINRGNSGGPLFNRAGEVIGVNTMIISPTSGNVGVGFAVPASLAQTVIDQIEQYGQVRRGWLGVQIQPVTEPLAEALGLEEPRGALVAAVIEDGPAAAAGLEHGDVILAFAGERVEQAADLPKIVSRLEPGAEVEAELVRDGGRERIRLEVGDREPEPLPLADSGEDEAAGKRDEDVQWGLALAPLDDAMRQHLGLPQDAEGVLVKNVRRGGPAARSGLRPGDLVVELAGESVPSLEALEERVETAKQSHSAHVVLRVRRGEQYRYVTLPV